MTNNPYDPKNPNNWQYHDEYEFWFIPFHDDEAKEKSKKPFLPWEHAPPADLCAHDKPLPNFGGWNCDKGEYIDDHLMAPLVIFTTGSAGNQKRYQGDDYAIVPVVPLTNAKPVDHAPLRDDAVKAVTEMYAALNDSDKWHKHFGMVKAALQPTVINKHEKLLKEARETLETAQKEIIAWRTGTNNREGFKCLHNAKVGACFGGYPATTHTIIKLDAALQPINQAEE